MTVVLDDNGVKLIHGNVRLPETVADLEMGSVRTIVTSPPYYGLRDYGEPEQLGTESTIGEYVANLVAVFEALRPILADNGTLWLNLGDSYANDAKTGLPPKSLIGVPWRVAFALQEAGWILRSDIVWAKPNPMPEPVADRPTSSHEFLFMFAKSPRYYYDTDAIAETATGNVSGNGFVRPESISRGGVGSDQPWKGRPQLRRALEIADREGLTEDHFAAIRAVGMSDAGKAREIQTGSGRNADTVQRLADEAKAKLGGYYREFLTGATRNRRDVWTVPTVPFTGSHFAVFPPELVRPCIRAGSAVGDLVLDPFSGSGTTGMVARQEGRRYVGIDVNRDYLDMSLRTRFAQPVMDIWDEVTS